DLPKKTFGIKIENNEFIPEYRIDASHKDIVDTLKKLAKDAKEIYIATDEDREGEAIGFHIAVAIGKNPNKLPRIVFHEITKGAIFHALENPRHLDMDKVNAQQARRLLDRIVGYRLSPLISAKIQNGLSAGRVQSSALKIIVDREREILAFKPIVYYTIASVFKTQKSLIEAELVEFGGKKIEKLSIQDRDFANNIVKTLQSDSFSVKDIETKRRKTSTPPPFMTSTLQQSASSSLGYSPARTMQIAQRLYEGVQTHKGSMGVITYMRTDSLNIAKEAQLEAREQILKIYGKEYVPAKPKIYASKAKGAQEAHEAIRPTLMDFTPQLAAQYLKPDELKLYTLIYKRFFASQMVDAEFELQNIFIVSKNATLKASGRKLLFDGFYRVLGSDDKDKLLPNLTPQSELVLDKCGADENQTEPPSRYSEASLIKTLESLGIGRPSTYAPTISLLSSRDYINIEKKQIRPSEIAFKVIELLEEYFNEIVDSKFSADLEEKLDLIAESKQDWQNLLWEFYAPFIEKISKGKTAIKSQKVAIPTGEFCPECGKELIQRSSRFGDFVGCSGYPKCKYIKKDSKEIEAKEQESLGVCEKCGMDMVKKRGKNGEFLACSGYPKCKNAKPLNAEQKSKPKELEGVNCPKCGGSIVERFSRRGAFYGCSNYPQCDFIAKHAPSNIPCPKCNSLMAKRVVRKKAILECVSCKEKIDDLQES
ncbi:MAG: type I DNA topoisomerase, partial [Helicobacter sp.]|nr:type I DNA topoisomerase [Helicobacter sp.]